MIKRKSVLLLFRHTVYFSSAAYVALCNAVIATCLPMIVVAKLATIPTYERWTCSAQMFHT
jgi:hypothetical protein